MKTLSLEKMEKIEGGLVVDIFRMQCAIQYLTAVDGASAGEVAIINSIFAQSDCAYYM